MASQDSYIQRLRDLDKSSPLFPDQLATLIAQVPVSFMSGLTNNDSLWVLEYLDNVCIPTPRLSIWFLNLVQALEDFSPFSLVSCECLCALARMTRTAKMLPKSLTLSTTHSVTSIHPITSGTIADVWEGTYNGCKVYVKQPRYFPATDGDTWRVEIVSGPSFTLPLAPLNGLAKPYQEAIVWKHLKHPNIVPFLGVSGTPFQLVSSWMSGGYLMEYLKRRPDADRLGLVCYPPVIQD